MSVYLNLIDPSQGVWLTGDLTNHNAESAIFVQQTNQTGEQINVNLKKMVCIDVFLWLKQNTFWCSFMFISCFNKIWKDDRFTRRLNWGTTAICHDTLKSHKMVFVVGSDKIWKLRLCFIPKVTCCLVCRRVVSFLFVPWCIFTAWKHDVWCESATSCQT